MRLTLSRPRFTIERLRTLVLVGGALLVAAIVIFLAAGHWTRRFLNKDLPRRLGINIEQQADGVNFTQTRKGKTIFKIHAARSVTMKDNGKTLLQDVIIDLYGEDGNRADTISGSEFEYDSNAGLATAAGAVEITMMRPGVKPAIAQLNPAKSKSRAAPPAMARPEKTTRANSAPNSTPGPALAPAAKAALNEISDDEIHIKTSGLVFNQKTGVATTAQRVDFALRQGNGNSIGATYDSPHGHLILDRAVELHILRANAQKGDGPVTVHAGHADFEHDAMACLLTQATAAYTGGSAQTANALIHFRDDGSVLQLDGSGGVDLRTQTGGHVTAPLGNLEFDGNNHPRHGQLQGGVRLEMNQPDRQVQGSSPTAQLTFDNLGQLSQTHLERGVIFNSRQQYTSAKGQIAQVRRSWTSQTADIAFAPAVADASGSRTPGQRVKPVSANGQTQSHLEPRVIHGYGGVVVTSETSSDGAVAPSRLSADTMAAELAPGAVLSSLLGTGHASFEERTSAGVHQSTTSDQLDVRFLPAPAARPKTVAAPAVRPKGTEAGSEIASIVEIGHVMLVQDPPPGHSAQPGGAAEAQAGIRATASRADYDGQSQILHLTGTPRVRDGALDITADRIDFARATGDAFARGDVRASWTGAGAQNSPPGASLPGASLLQGNQPGAGGNGPVHAIAAEAELHQATQEIIFRGAGSVAGKEQAEIQPRLWQSANSVSAPVITLNRRKQTLTAEASGAANPVRTVLLSNSPAPNASGASAAARKSSLGKAEFTQAGSSGAATKAQRDAPSVIRVRSGDLHYSEGERLAVFHSGGVGSVVAETTGTGGTATVVAQEAEVQLLPETHSGSSAHAAEVASSSANTSSPANANPSNSSVDRLTARGHVVVDWPDRRGMGEKLVYLSEDGTFTLTGSSSVPPRIADLARGTVTGSALIYHSRDDSVTVEGDGGKTETDTRSKR